MSDAGTPEYKIGTIARLSGFQAGLLRAWERRHGLLQPVRVPSGHRRYTQDDLAVLRRVRELMEQGRAIGEIATIGRETLLEEANAQPVTMLPAADSVQGVAYQASSEQNDALQDLRERLVQHAIQMGEAALEQTVTEAFGLFPPAVVIAEVLEPVAYELGHLWSIGRCPVAAEHLAMRQFNSRLQQLLSVSQPPTSAQHRAITACLPQEYHEFSSLVVAYHLTRLGVRTTHLGADLPLDEVDGAIRSLSPDLVCLSSTVPDLARQQLDSLQALARRYPTGPRILFGGQGVQPLRAALEEAGAHVQPATRPVLQMSLADFLG